MDRCSGISKGVRRDFALLGIRRIGKTSVLAKLLSELEKKEIATVLFDCQGLQFGLEELDVVFFSKLYGAAVLDEFFKKAGRKEKVIELFKLSSKELVLKLSSLLGGIKNLNLAFLEEWFSVVIEFEQKEKPSQQELLQLFEKTINLPEKLAEERRLHCVIVFDEFQSMKKFKLPGELLAILRRNMQKHKRVSYIVSGSNVGMMREMLLDLESPFGANFFVLWLGPFDKETAKEFLEKSFKEEGIKADKEAILEIVDFTGGNPAYLNWVGEKSSHIKKLSVENVKEIEKEAFKPYNLGYLFEKELLKLKRFGATKTFQVLKAMAAYDLNSPTEIAKKLKGITTTDVIIYLSRLEKYGYVEQKRRGFYELIDPMLKKYLKSKTVDYY